VKPYATKETKDKERKIPEMKKMHLKRRYIINTLLECGFKHERMPCVVYSNAKLI